MRWRFGVFVGIGVAASFLSGARAEMLVRDNFVMLTDVSPGKEINLDNLLTKVRNTGGKSSVYTVSFSVTAMNRKGYESIPDLTWFTPLRSELSVAAGLEADVKGFRLKIPAKAENYNRHFQGQLTVRDNQAIATEVSIPIWIETDGKAFTSLSELPKGYGLMPSTVNLKGNSVGEISLYNNTPEKHDYTVFIALPAQRSGPNIMPQTPGYEWSKDESDIEINIKDGKQIARNRYEVALWSGDILPIQVRYLSEVVSKKSEVFLVSVQRGSNEWRLARIQKGLGGGKE